MEENDLILRKAEITFLGEPYVVTYENTPAGYCIHRIEKVVKKEITYEDGNEISNLQTVKIYDKVEQMFADEILNYIKQEKILEEEK